MSINRQEFTNSGRDMLGRANAGETLAITGVVIGSGRANAPADLWPRTELFNHEMNVVIIQQVDQGDGILLVDAAFNSSQAPNAFELCELGVMAHIGTEPDRLYSVANVLATGADNVDPAVESIHAFKIKVVIDRAPNVTVVIGTSGDILGENIGAETVGPGWFKEKIANTLRFKRAVAGTGIELIEDPAEPFAVTIAQKIVRVDLDLYVPLTNPGGTPATRFPTIQAALDSLDDVFIAPGRTARINVAAQVYPTAGSIIVNHPQGHQIQILGSAPIQTNIIGASYAGVGGAGYHEFQMAVAGNPGIVAGDWVLVDNIVGSNEALIYGGFHEVSTIGAGYVQIRINFQGPENPGGIPIVGGRMRKLGVIIRTTSLAAIGFIIRGHGLGFLTNIGFVGPGAGSNHGIVAESEFNLETVGVSRYLGQFGFYAQKDGVGRLKYCHVTECRVGIGGSQSRVQLYVIDCFSSFNPDYNFQIEATYCRFTTEEPGSSGVVAYQSDFGALIGNDSTVLIDSLTVVLNQSGLRIANDSTVIVDTGGSLQGVSTLGSHDFFLTIMSLLYNAGGTISGTCNLNLNGVMSLTGNTVGCYYGSGALAEEEEAPEVLPEI
jgi:hypothetical protein